MMDAAHTELNGRIVGFLSLNYRLETFWLCGAKALVQGHVHIP